MYLTSQWSHRNRRQSCFREMGHTSLVWLTGCGLAGRRQETMAALYPTPWGGREGGRKEGREDGKERGRKGEREGGKERGRVVSTCTCISPPLHPPYIPLTPALSHINWYLLPPSLPPSLSPSLPPSLSLSQGIEIPTSSRENLPPDGVVYTSCTNGVFPVLVPVAGQHLSTTHTHTQSTLGRLGWLPHTKTPIRWNTTWRMLSHSLAFSLFIRTCMYIHVHVYATLLSI